MGIRDPGDAGRLRDLGGHERPDWFGNAYFGYGTSGTSMYDTMMRLPLLVWALFCATVQYRGLVQYQKSPIDFMYAIYIVMRLSTIVFLLLVVAVVILRTRPSEKATGLEPRIAALAGSFLTYAIVLFPRRELSASLEITSTTLTLIGTLGAVFSLSQLGRSFSVMAESRQLVTTGFYHFVRHPLYLTEEIAIVGVFIQFASVWTTLVLALQVAFQLRRMDNEEAILTASFPEYVAYSRTTSRLIPGVY
jgi:protein-S-isoprenylcysteine O-methyltransferase Ste14